MYTTYAREGAQGDAAHPKIQCAQPKIVVFHLFSSLNKDHMHKTVCGTPNKLYDKRKYTILASAISKIWLHHFVDFLYEGKNELTASHKYFAFSQYSFAYIVASPNSQGSV